MGAPANPTVRKSYDSIWKKSLTVEDGDLTFKKYGLTVDDIISEFKDATKVFIPEHNMMPPLPP